jgi:hypothetical protein
MVRYEKHTQTVMYGYETGDSHSVDHKYYNLVGCNDVGVTKRRAAQDRNGKHFLS